MVVGTKRRFFTWFEGLIRSRLETPVWQFFPGLFGPGLKRKRLGATLGFNGFTRVQRGGLYYFLRAPFKGVTRLSSLFVSRPQRTTGGPIFVPGGYAAPKGVPPSFAPN